MTMTGKNIRHILDSSNETDIFKIIPKQFRTHFKFEKLPVDEEWKINLVKEIVDIKNDIVVLNDKEALTNPEGFTTDELDQILHFVCTC